MFNQFPKWFRICCWFFPLRLFAASTETQKCELNKQATKKAVPTKHKSNEKANKKYRMGTIKLGNT